MFFLILPGFALLSAIVAPSADRIFLAAGGMFILGGGILLVYIGYLSHRRWMAAFLLCLGLLFSGPPFSPMAVWSASVYPDLLTARSVPVLLALFLSHAFIFCALVRAAFDPVEEFPSNEPLFLLTFSLGMVVSLSFLFYPGWNGIQSVASLATPILLLLIGIALVFLVRIFHRTGTSLFLFLERFFRLEWLQRGFAFSFQQTAVLVSGVERFLSGEGALLWSLGIALLLYLVFRGG
jgi:hypothetical protein